MKKLPFYIYIFLFGVAIAQAASYFSVMPATMASHFGFDGKPNGWMAKEPFFIIEFFVILITTGSFFVMPWAFEKFKVTKSMNLPNKEYWTAPERIQIVYDYFKESFAWFSVATMVLLLGVFQSTFEANLKSSPVLDDRWFLILFGGYIIFVIIWMIQFYQKFNKLN